VFSIISLEVLQRIFIVFPKLPHDILAHIAIILLHLPRDFQLVLRRHIHHFTALTHKIENELRYVASSDGNVLDCTPDNVPLGAGDDVGDAIAGVDDGAGERAIGDAAGSPRCCKCEHSLDGDIKSFDVEGLEEDLGCLFSVFGRVERGLRLECKSTTRVDRESFSCRDVTYKEEVMIFRLGP
jgi:hypothetical protein